VIDEIIKIAGFIWDAIMKNSEVWLEVLRLILSWQVLTFMAFLILRRRIFMLLNALIKKIPQATQLWTGSKFNVHSSIDMPNQKQTVVKTNIDESKEDISAINSKN